MNNKYYLNLFTYYLLFIGLTIEIVSNIICLNSIKPFFVLSIIMCSLMLVIFIIQFIKTKKILTFLSLVLLVFFISYLSIIIQLYPYFFKLQELGDFYYNTSFTFPGFYTITRRLENVYFSRISSDISIISFNFYFYWIFLLLEFINMLIKKNRTYFINKLIKENTSKN